MNATIGRPALLKLYNCKKIMSILLNNQPATITDIAEKTGISKTTTIKIFKLLKEKNFIIPLGKGKSSAIGGKRPDRYQQNTDLGYSLTFYIRKTGVYYYKQNIANIMSDKKMIKYDKQHSRDSTASWIANICNGELNSIYKEHKICYSIILVFEGIIENFDDEEQLAYDFPYWINAKNIITNFKNELNYTIPVIFDTHHRFSLLAEKKFQTINDNKNIVYLECTEDGVGGAIYNNSRISYGNNFIAGELGHMILCPDSLLHCKCGGRGCFESLVSINNLLQQAGNSYNTSITLRKLAKLYKNDDKTAVELIDKITFWFALAINNIFMVTAPNHLILAGSYSIFGDRFLTEIYSKFQTLSLTKVSKDLKLTFSSLNSKSSIIGGNILAIDNYFKQDEIYQ